MPLSPVTVQRHVVQSWCDDSNIAWILELPSCNNKETPQIQRLREQRSFSLTSQSKEGFWGEWVFLLHEATQGPWFLLCCFLAISPRDCPYLGEGGGGGAVVPYVPGSNQKAEEENLEEGGPCIQAQARGHSLPLLKSHVQELSHSVHPTVKSLCCTLFGVL